MSKVLEFAWVDLMSDIQKVSDLDELVQAHANYLKRMIKTSMLESVTLRSILESLCKKVLAYCRVYV